MEIFTVYWIQLISIILKYNELQIAINKFLSFSSIVYLLSILFE